MLKVYSIHKEKRCLISTGLRMNSLNVNVAEEGCFYHLFSFVIIHSGIDHRTELMTYGNEY